MFWGAAKLVGAKKHLVTTLCSSFRIGKMIIQAAKTNAHHQATPARKIDWHILVAFGVVYGTSPIKEHLFSSLFVPYCRIETM